MPAKVKSDSNVQHQAVMKDFLISLMTSFSSVPGCPEPYRKKLLGCVTELGKTDDAEELVALGSKIETICNSVTKAIEKAPEVEQRIDQLSALTTEMEEADKKLLNSSDEALGLLDDHIRMLSKVMREEKDPKLRAIEAKKILNGARETVACFKKELSASKTYLRKAQNRVQVMAEKVRKTQMASFKDGLTGLNDRNGLIAVLNGKLEATPSEKSLALVAFEIDNFADINDKFGRIVGNALLVKLSQTISGSIPEDAYPAKTATDRFAVMMPVDSAEVAEGYALRLQKRIGTTRWKHHSGGKQQSVSATVSAGIAMRRKSDTAEKLINRATAALQKARKQGNSSLVVDI